MAKRNTVGVADSETSDTNEVFKTSKKQGNKKKWCIGISVTVGVAAIGGIIAGIVIATQSSPTECVDATCTLSPDEQSIEADCFEDTKACGTDTCECDDVDKSCCVPIFETARTNCAGKTVPFSRVASCMCRPCTEQKIAVSGRIKRICDNCIVIIAINGTIVDESSPGGYFHFETDRPSGDRIVLTLVDTKNAYFQQIKTVNLGGGRQVYSNIDVVMTVKPNVTTIIDASVGGPAYPNNDTSSTFSLEFPPDSMRAANGSIYKGDVTVRLDFVDPGLTEEVDRIPGQLLVDMPGTNETGFLSSSGMFQIDLTADDGSQLEASDVTIFLDPKNLDANETEGTELWELSEVTGTWERSKTSKRPQIINGGARIGRSARNLNLIAINLQNLRPRRIWNLDALLIRYCYVKVRIFKDQAISYQNQINGVTLASLYLRSENRGWANYIRTYSWWNGACVQVPCDGYDRTSVSKVIIQAPGYYPYPPKVSQDVLQSVNYTEFANGFEIEIPREGLPGVYTNTGPFYPSYWYWYYSCYSNRYDIDNEEFFVFGRKPYAQTTVATEISNSTAANYTEASANSTIGLNENTATQSIASTTRTTEAPELTESYTTTTPISNSPPTILTTKRSEASTTLKATTTPSIVRSTTTQAPGLTESSTTSAQSITTSKAATTQTITAETTTTKSMVDTTSQITTAAREATTTVRTAEKTTTASSIDASTPTNISPETTTYEYLGSGENPPTSPYSN